MASWVENEMLSSKINDSRLNNRMSKLLTDFSGKPEASIPAACQGWAETQAAYRFIDNKKLNFSDILSGHYEATVERIKSQKVVLICQDTTFLNYGIEKKLDFGTLKRTERDQYLLHPSVAFTPSRVNLGVLGAKFWQRPEKKVVRSRDKRPIEEKESYRWLESYAQSCEIQATCPDTLIVNVADREGDIHEWFLDAQKQPENAKAHYLVRAKCNRCVEDDAGNRDYLWEALNASASLGKFSITTPRNKQAKPRKVTLDLYAKEITLTGRGGHDREPVTLYAVLAKENKPPANQKGIEWMLLTSLPAEDFTTAQTVVGLYRARWEIEIFFRVLKQGCSVQSLRLETDKRLINSIALYLIVSWRLHRMTMMSREFPKLPCTNLFSTKEWKMIYLQVKKKKPPKRPPNLQEMVCLLAQVGGFLARKGDGDPGIKTIWTGFQRLVDYLEAIDLHKSVYG